MKFHWSWKSVPELAGLTPEERKRICRSHKYKLFRDRRYWVLTVLFMICFGFAAGSAPGLRDRFLPDSGVWGIVVFPGVACAILGGIFGVLLSQIQLQAMLPYIRKELELRRTN